MANELETITRIRKKYPLKNPGGSPLGDDGWMAIVEVAQALGGQVFRKDAGEHVLIPAGLLAKYPSGVYVNRTIVGRGVFRNAWYKVFGDGEGAASPIWRLGDTPADGEYVDVSGIKLPGVEDPPPPAGDVESRLKALEAAVKQIRTALHGA